MAGSALSALVGAISICLVFTFYLASLDIPSTLSPQGCRMSWMSPSYLLQSTFNTSWTPLAKRYSLWLYREVGWDSNDQLNGSPVLFIPGNAGSSHQVRSIASSATRQFFSSPFEVAPEFQSSKPLDFFAVEFNEDLSAFHGPTLDSERKYTARAIDYILSQYSPNTTIIVLGHSMGGVVAVSLLPSPHISTIITMSTPHTVPPARFDRRIENIFDQNADLIRDDPTPIISLCGGATDMMVPSESCVLPENGKGIYRRTVFTSALEGAWTGVGHREMVWCHQVRWRIARAALGLGNAVENNKRLEVLNRWLRVGDALTSSVLRDDGETLTLAHRSGYEILHAQKQLVLRNPRGSQTYLIPVPRTAAERSAKFVLYVSQGSILHMAPQNPISLRASVHLCRPSAASATPVCKPFPPSILKLIPHVNPNRPFPVPDEGSDESEGVVLYEADVPGVIEDETWLGIKIDGGDGNGWVLGAFVVHAGPIEHRASMIASIFGTVSFAADQLSVRTQFNMPNLLSSVLVVYRLRATLAGSCTGTLLPLLLAHASHSQEEHYYPLSHAYTPSVLLHTHTSGPYIYTPRAYSRGMNLTVYSSGECGVSHLEITLDWWSTLGRWGMRYWTAIAGWTVGVVATMIFTAWGLYNNESPMPSVYDSLSIFAQKTLPSLLGLVFAASFVPMPAEWFLGNVGEPLLSPIAPLVLFIASGLVWASWWILLLLMWPLRLLSATIGRRMEDTTVRQNGILSTCFIFFLIFIFIPWQVAFFGCWIIHLYTCATTSLPITSPGDTGKEEGEEILATYHNKMHVLLLMTWLLPLVAPILAVWVRTLATAGITTPFNGDHNFLNAAPFVVLTDFASWTSGPLFIRDTHQPIAVKWTMWTLAFFCFLFGARATYKIFDVVNIAMSVIIAVKIGPRYWGGRP